jgi:hypothetical protein
LPNATKSRRSISASTGTRCELQNAARQKNGSHRNREENAGTTTSDRAEQEACMGEGETMSSK